MYLNLPTLRNFRGDTKWLAGKFESDYTANWRGPGGYSEILHAAPSASIPDDHEYWNNAPHNSPIVWQSNVEPSRNNWWTAARTMYEAFQLSRPGQYRQAGVRAARRVLGSRRGLATFRAGLSVRWPSATAWLYTQRRAAMRCPRCARYARCGEPRRAT